MHVHSRNFRKYTDVQRAKGKNPDPVRELQRATNFSLVTGGPRSGPLSLYQSLYQFDVFVINTLRNSVSPLYEVKCEKVRKSFSLLRNGLCFPR